MNSNRPGPQYAELLRKLRARPLSSWEFGDRLAVIRGVLAELALLAQQSGNPGAESAPTVPDIGAHGLADQLAVLIMDARRAGVPADRIDQLVAEMVEALGISGAI